MLKTAIKATTPVMLGYIPTGIALGLLANFFQLEWYVAPLMSIVIYSGAMQLIALGFFMEHPGLLPIGITALLLNLRHSFFGLSLLSKYADTGLVKPYLIHSLTDETYALIATSNNPEFEKNKKLSYFLISFLNHLYWITGTTLGVILGKVVAFNTKGLDFAIIALFTVLTVNQFKQRKSNLPFIIAFFTGLLGIIFIDKYTMLLASISVSTILILLLKKRLPDESE